ncbi:HDOD domain-containing protein [Azohydromonas caseinilytica]|uniref:HDOD domain-containing protein n=1 Tax=Azohydromonas caseinilytica TaxID=2728836 RepID=A0A848FHA4_9BURK|nr:HDOD domain-containing protein [Azohydromonas caseinilytica]NML18642.1 HDOD domain-containing protein [Azohydromonas caseinilytica]
MPVDPQLRRLDVSIPTQPHALAQLSPLLAREEVALSAVSALIETDMALAAAVLRAVNSSLYGLRGRVQTVHQALTYLGLREVAAITFEIGLRAVFPQAHELEPVWRRAVRRGLLMGRMAQRLGSTDAWAAHSAGLFEECGKAVLFRHDCNNYRTMLHDAGDDDVALSKLERARFGVSHDALGAALCESWGLAGAAVACVRQHVAVQHGAPLPQGPQRPTVLALSAVAYGQMHAPDTLNETVQRVAPEAGLDPARLLETAQRVQQQLDSATQGG